MSGRRSFVPFPAEVPGEGPDSGSAGGTVTDVTGSAPIVITGVPTATPNVTITPATGAAAGSMSAVDKTFVTSAEGALPNIVQAIAPGPTITSAPVTFTSASAPLTLSATGAGKSIVTATAQVDASNGATSVAGNAVKFSLLKSVNGGPFVTIAGAPVFVAELTATQTVCGCTLCYLDTNPVGDVIEYAIQAGNATVSVDTLSIQVGRASIVAQEVL
jgi:hypothetical protein